MKRNNKFRGNTIYSLNYKFDSVSAAGKFCGTALDLIKKYNELAKEAHSNGNYVEMEVFRQYAEHYRKIVTEINERKSQFYDAQNDTPAEQPAPEIEASTAVSNVAESAQTESASIMKPEAQTEQPPAEKKSRRQRTFTIVEVADKNAEPVKTDSDEVAAKPRRRRVLHKTAEA